MMRAPRRWRVPTLLPVTNDADLQDRLSFAIFWAMWKRDVTPPALAKGVGKSADTIRRWRDGDSTPSVLDVGPLARALGVRVDYFTNPPAVPDYPFGEYAIPPTPPDLTRQDVAAAVDARLPEIAAEVRARGRIPSAASTGRSGPQPKRSSARAK